MCAVITEVKLETHVVNCISCDLFQLKRLIWLRIEEQQEPPTRMRRRNGLRCACSEKRTRITNRVKRTSDHAADKCARKRWIGDGRRETERESVMSGRKEESMCGWLPDRNKAIEWSAHKYLCISFEWMVTLLQRCYLTRNNGTQ